VKVCLALIVLWAAAVPAFAQADSDTNGTETSHFFAVSDGDTVKFGRQRVRLFGIDAPEKGQPCDGGHWYPGPLATKALIAFIAGRPVSCHQVDYDQKNNRPVATCFAGKDDLQALMVGAGWAWAYTAFSDQYVDAETGGSARRRRSRASLSATMGVAGATPGRAIVGRASRSNDRVEGILSHFPSLQENRPTIANAVVQ
jgi:endonuclease YncB( thermonuclease family)